MPTAGNPYVGDYPWKAVNLNYYFSRLTLNSTALRTYHCGTSFRPLSAARKKHAEVAINSAIATLTVVLDVPSVQESLVGTQLFLHSMITFAAVFLLKIAVKVHPNCVIGPNSQRNSLAAAGLDIDIPYIIEVIEKIVKIMISASEKASERHVSHHIARGLGKMLEGFREWEQRNTQHNNRQPLRPQQPSWLHDTPSLFSTVSLTNPQTLGGRATILNHPPAMLGVAPLSSERGSNNTNTPNNNNNTNHSHNNHNNHNHNHNHNSFPPSSTADLSAKSQIGLSEGSLDPMMTDMWGFEEEYFPMGVFDFLQSQMPA